VDRVGAAGHAMSLAGRYLPAAYGPLTGAVSIGDRSPRRDRMCRREAGSVHRFVQPRQGRGKQAPMGAPSWPMRAPAAQGARRKARGPEAREATSPQVPASAVRECHSGRAGPRRSVGASRHGYPRRPSSRGSVGPRPIPGSPPPVPRGPCHHQARLSRCVSPAAFCNRCSFQFNRRAPGGHPATIRCLLTNREGRAQGTAPCVWRQDHSAMFSVRIRFYAAGANPRGKEVPRRNG